MFKKKHIYFFPIYFFDIFNIIIRFMGDKKSNFKGQIYTFYIIILSIL